MHWGSTHQEFLSIAQLQRLARILETLFDQALLQFSVRDCHVIIKIKRKKNNIKDKALIPEMFNFFV